jgi:hypothetical protein
MPTSSVRNDNAFRTAVFMAMSRLVALPPFSGPSGSLRPIGIQKSGVSANG